MLASRVPQGGRSDADSSAALRPAVRPSSGAGRRLHFLLAFLLFATTPSGVLAGPLPDEWTDGSVLPLEQDWELLSCHLRPNGMLAVLRIARGGRQFLMLGGTREPEFEEVDPPIFATSTLGVAYRAVENKKELVVINGAREERFDNVGKPVWSPDGQTVAYAAGRGGRAFVVVGGVPGPEYDDVGTPSFLPGTHDVAYRATLEGRMFVVKGKDRGPNYLAPTLARRKQGIGEIAVGPDGRVAHGVYHDEAMEMLVDGRPDGPKFDWVGDPVFSPDGILGYRATKGARSCVVVGGAAGPLYDAVSRPSMDEGGGRGTYTARKGASSFLVHNGVLGPEYRVVALPALFPRTGRFAYVAGTHAGEWSVVTSWGPVAGLFKSKPSTPAFSSDGTKLVFLAPERGRVVRRVLIVP